MRAFYSWGFSWLFPPLHPLKFLPAVPIRPAGHGDAALLQPSIFRCGRAPVAGCVGLSSACFVVGVGSLWNQFVKGMGSCGICAVYGNLEGAWYLIMTLSFLGHMTQLVRQVMQTEGSSFSPVQLSVCESLPMVLVLSLVMRSALGTAAQFLFLGSQVRGHDGTFFEYENVAWLSRTQLAADSRVLLLNDWIAAGLPQSYACSVQFVLLSSCVILLVLVHWMPTWPFVVVPVRVERDPWVWPRGLSQGSRPYLLAASTAFKQRSQHSSKIVQNIKTFTAKHSSAGFAHSLAKAATGRQRRTQNL